MLVLDVCWAFVVTATMYGEEVANKGSSQEGSVQELMDYIHRFRRPKEVERKGPFKVPYAGFGCEFKRAFEYVEKLGLSPKSIYPWVGVGCRDPKEVIMCDPEKEKWNGIAKIDGRDIQYVSKFTVHTFF